MLALPAGEHKDPSAANRQRAGSCRQGDIGAGEGQAAPAGAGGGAGPGGTGAAAGRGRGADDSGKARREVHDLGHALAASGGGNSVVASRQAARKGTAEAEGARGIGGGGA